MQLMLSTYIFYTERIHDALNFSLNTSLYKIRDFARLGQSNQPYSISLWIQPKILQEAPLLHLSSQSDAKSLSARSGSSYDSNMIAHSGTFQGLIVELHVYVKELTQDHIDALGNP
ncbi:hypothetical protein I4U23_015331 [Adineta vaga]|nr:hypothetical protein I4U23_015331 [Adineta vaga]